MTDNIVQNKTACYSDLIKHVAADKRIMATHLSLLTAMFVLWQESSFDNAFLVSRKKLMAFSKIGSVATYHKCIRELDEYGYIIYKPSYHPRVGSLVQWPRRTPSTKD